MAEPAVTPPPAPVTPAPAAPAPNTTEPAAATPPAGSTLPTTELGGAPPPADPAKPVDPAKPGEPEKPAAEPVKFDAAKLTLPEGMKSEDPLFQDFTKTLVDDKLDPQARGQAMIDLYAKGVKAIQEANTAAWNKVNEAWVNAVKADPEIGGAKFAETKTTIAKAIDSLGPELSVAFRQGLDATGAGNHPAIWKGLAKMAALLTEGGHVSGAPLAAGKPSVKDAFYPNSPDMK